MKVKLSNVGIIHSCDVEFIPGVNLIIGSSGSGKSTLMKCIHSVATNNFTDADISFGKSSMTASIKTGNCEIIYERSTSKSEKSKYIINGEQYVKLGRSALPAVTESFKVGDININGDDINFNFNLQFSSPFLIFGSQSTLYNVLTYRSSFDIASINDLYNQEVKSVNNEITYNNKLKDKLKESLSELETRESQLSQIEKIYCRYTNLKHDLESLDELKFAMSKFDAVSSISDRCENLNSILSVLSLSLKNTAELIDLNDYKMALDGLKTTSSKCLTCDECNLSYNKAINLISSLVDQQSLLEKIIEQNRLVRKIDLISSYRHDDTIDISDKVKDLCKLEDLLVNRSKLIYMLGHLSYKNHVSINEIDDLVDVYRKLLELDSELQVIERYSSQLSAVIDQLGSFKICPLCEKPLDGDHHG